jgi:hypothetical protein
MQKTNLILVLVAVFLSLASLDPALAKPERGEISGRTVAGSLLSLIVWPGIGQAMNDNPGNKVLTHAIVGILPPFRFWSAYDALFDREGGYWDGKV